MKVLLSTHNKELLMTHCDFYEFTVVVEAV